MRLSEAYETLNVPHQATPDETRKAYRRLALTEHPDKSDAPNATERFQKIQDAYTRIQRAEESGRYDDDDDDMDDFFDDGFGFDGVDAQARAVRRVVPVVTGVVPFFYLHVNNFGWWMRGWIHGFFQVFDQCFMSSMIMPMFHVFDVHKFYSSFYPRKK